MKKLVFCQFFFFSHFSIPWISVKFWFCSPGKEEGKGNEAPVRVRPEEGDGEPGGAQED